MAPADSPKSYFPIREISAFHRNWTICARITNISDVRTFSKGSNGGKVFSVDLLDAEGGEIRANFFNKAVDQYQDKVKKGKCFTFAGGNVRVANRQYNTCNHRYELIFDAGARIEEVADNGGIQDMKFSFIDLRAVQAKPLPCTVDICGVLVGFKPCLSFTSQAGKQLVKRELVIADDTASSISVTLWGERAQQEDALFEGNPTIALKSVNVKEWNGGRAGSLMQNGAMVLKSSCDEAMRVQKWWTHGGGATQTLTELSVSSPVAGGGRALVGKSMDLSEMRRVTEKLMDQPEVYNVVCRLSAVQMRKQGEVQPLSYMACQEPREGSGLPCNRRLDESGFCALCSRAGKAAPRLNLRCCFADYDNSVWLTTFHEAAEAVLGKKAEVLRPMEAGQREDLESMVRERYFSEPFQLTVRAKLDMYQGEARTNITCVSARPLSTGEHGRIMLKEIQDMLAA